MPSSDLALLGNDKEEIVELKKFVLLASVVALVVVALALPALAHNSFSRDDNPRYEERPPERFANFLVDYFYADNDWWEEEDDDGAAPAVTQEFDQEAESGDVDQSFTVTGSGDSSNQSAAVQGTANTGNAQNQIGVFQIGSEADDFELDEVGSSIEVSPTTTTSSDQEVDQAASASD
jgi:hypothetical protein